MIKAKKVIILLLITLLTPFVLLSQEITNDKEEVSKEESVKEESNKKDKIYTLGEVLVRDKKIKPGVVSVIKGEDIKKSTKTDVINVVNENVPSFYTGNNRVMGFGVAGSGAAQMSIRGIGVSSWSPWSGSGPTTGVPILINGMDAGMMINNHPIADIFSMKNIERIEVMHGPQPVLYGGGAMGGIINIMIERKEHDGYNTEISASYGSWNTTEDYVSHQGKSGSFDYGVSYNFRYTDGDRSQVINGTEFDSRYMSNNGTVHTGYEINKNWYIALDGYIMDLDIHDPGAEGELSDKLEYFDILRGGSILQIANSYNKLEGTLQFYGNWGKHKSFQPAYDDRQKYDSFDQMLGMKLKESMELDFGMTITAGSEYRWYGGKSEDVDTGYTYTDNKYIHETSFFALVDQSLFENIWLLSGGGRYTYNSTYGHYGAWQAGTIVHPHKTTKLFFQSAQGFKVPDIIQYYNKWQPGDTTINESGTDLDPETYISVEVGIEQSVSDCLLLSLTGYRIYSDNKFTKDVVGMGITEWYNAGEFNYNGIESSVKFSPVKPLSLSAGYSFIDNEQNGKRLPYVPRHKLLSGISFEKFGLLVRLNGEFVMDIYANEEERKVGMATIPLKKLDDYYVLNSKIAYTFLENYRLFVDLNNITNNKYSTYAIYKMPFEAPANTFLDYPMPGFNWKAGVSASF